MTRARDGPGRPAGDRARAYALAAALLSQGSPAGALLLMAVLRGRSPAEELSANGPLYLYMSVATLIAFTAFGWVLGRSADVLVAERRSLRGANHRLRWLSDVDALTGVLNRRAVTRRLRAELQRAGRDGSAVALLMLDLDHFKQVNDLFGHAAGDRVLRRVGRCLRRMARATDVVGRIGGEEFLAVLPATERADAWRSAERLRLAIGRSPDDPGTPPVTTSIGVVVVPGRAAVDLEASLRLADAALYQAKDAGRNRVSVSAAFQEADAEAIDRGTGGSDNMSTDRISR